jgi:hypothetical protein
MTIRNILISIYFILPFVISATILAGEQFYPVRIIRSSEAYPSLENVYSAEKAFDNNPETYCCLLDMNRTGNHGNETIPPNGATLAEIELQNLRKLYRTTIEPEQKFLQPFQTINHFGHEEKNLFIKRWQMTNYKLK